MQVSEEIKCLKCLSFSPATMSYCRYCHQRFAFGAELFAEDARKDRRINAKLAFAAAGLAALVAGYLIYKF